MGDWRVLRPLAVAARRAGSLRGIGGRAARPAAGSVQVGVAGTGGVPARAQVGGVGGVDAGYSGSVTPSSLARSFIAMRARPSSFSLAFIASP